LVLNNLKFNFNYKLTFYSKMQVYTKIKVSSGDNLCNASMFFMWFKIFRRKTPKDTFQNPWKKSKNKAQKRRAVPDFEKPDFSQVM
jgi:hypothetical protein